MAPSRLVVWRIYVETQGVDKLQLVAHDSREGRVCPVGQSREGAGEGGFLCLYGGQAEGQRKED